MQYCTLYYGMQCCATLCYAVLCFAMLFHAVLSFVCYAVLYYALLVDQLENVPSRKVPEDGHGCICYISLLKSETTATHLWYMFTESQHN